jgi:1A family penicillin-binding protein
VKLLARIGILVLIILFLGIASFLWLFHDLPSLDSLPKRLITPSVRIVDRNGKLLYEALAEEGGRHAVVPLEEIPPALRQATIATEDKNFYTNPGVDYQGVMRAIWFNLRGGGTISGGSTITQQVARNLLLEESERSQRILRRKLREIYLAWKLTQHLSKDEILALYLNQTYYGGMAYGVEAAAQTFFGKPVSDLDLAESALLVGLPQSPSTYNPFTDPQAAKGRQKTVLGLMESDGFITADQRAFAEREPLVYAESPYPIEAPHFIMMVRAMLDELFTPEQVYQAGGLVVRTTLNLDWQKHAERAVSDQLEALRNSDEGIGHNVNSAALVAIDPGTGEILALVGSPDYFDAAIGGAINMALSPRQPGSALKSLVYAVALDPENPGGGWTAATMLLDVRTSFLTHDGKVYTPENYDSKEHGPVLVREALGSSLNIPAVITLNHVGLERLFSLTSKLGIDTLGDPRTFDLSLALGGGAVRLLDLTAAYGTFANGGLQVEPRAILEVQDFQGDVLYRPPENSQVRVLDKRVAWLISDILSDNEARRLGFGAYSILRLDRPAAVKTGTTTNFHDNWTVGYTPDLVVGVWSGNTDYQPMREVNGLTGAAPIWHQFMRTVLTGEPIKTFAQPSGMLQVEVCALSGLIPTEPCPYRRDEWFFSGTQPVLEDTFYRIVTLDASTGFLANQDTPPDRRVTQVALDLPLQARSWARQEGILLYSDLISQTVNILPSNISNSSSRVAIQIISPSANSTYWLSTELAPAAQRILVEAMGEPGLREVTLWVDSELVAQLTTAPYQTWWTLEIGEHRIWAEAVRENGESVSSEVVSIVVK